MRDQILVEIVAVIGNRQPGLGARAVDIEDDAPDAANGLADLAQDRRPFSRVGDRVVDVEHQLANVVTHLEAISHDEFPQDLIRITGNTLAQPAVAVHFA